LNGAPDCRVRVLLRVGLHRNLVVHKHAVGLALLLRMNGWRFPSLAWHIPTSEFSDDGFAGAGKSNSLTRTRAAHIWRLSAYCSHCPYLVFIGIPVVIAAAVAPLSFLSAIGVRKNRRHSIPCQALRVSTGRSFAHADRAQSGDMRC
jgi:hypothetical protein